MSMWLLQQSKTMEGTLVCHRWVVQTTSNANGCRVPANSTYCWSGDLWPISCSLFKLSHGASDGHAPGNEASPNVVSSSHLAAPSSGTPDRNLPGGDDNLKQFSQQPQSVPRVWLAKRSPNRNKTLRTHFAGFVCFNLPSWMMHYQSWFM